MRKALLGASVLALGGLLIAATPSGPLAFSRIRPGGWQLRALDGSAPTRRICLTDPAELIQLRHPGATCSRFVLDDAADTATIHYTCTGAGYGRTTIKVETGELIRIDSQGLINQAPFQVALEGRRLGSCGPEQARR
jgi:hypothetical protein